MFRIFAMVIFVGVIFMGLAIYGDQSKAQPAQQEYKLDVELGMVAKAVTGGNLNLRATPPIQSAGWYVKGEPIGVIAAGEGVTIKEIKKIPLTGQTWMKVERHNPKALPKSGWVYFGGFDYLKVAEEPKE